MTKIFLGSSNIDDGPQGIGGTQGNFKGFLGALIEAGFPESRINRKPTGAWLDVSGTQLTVHESYVGGMTTKTLRCGEQVLAMSERQPYSMLGVKLIYTFYPQVIATLPPGWLPAPPEESRPPVEHVLTP